MIAGSIVNILQKRGTGSPTPPTNPDTTPDGKQVYLIVGDSNAGDTSAAVTLGPTTLPDTCFKWVSGVQTELTTLDLNNSGAIYGTAYKQFALNRYSRVALKSVFINQAHGGSEFIANGDNNNWSETGANYAPAVAAANDCLEYNELTKLKGIFVICGTNDVREGTLTLPAIKTGMDSLFARLQADFPDTPIYCVTTGMYNGAVVTMDARKYGMIKNFFDVAIANPNVEIVSSLYNLYVWGYGFGDSLHLTTAGYNKVGEQLERAVSSTETTKEIRRMQTMLHNEPDSTKKAGIKVFYDKGYFIDGLQTYVGGTKNKLLYDWTGYTCPLDSNFDVVDNNYIHTDTNKYLRTNFITSFMARNTSATDFIEGFKTGVNLTPVATGGIPIGTAAGGLRRVFQTTASTVTWCANDATSTVYSGWTKIPDNTKIAIGRNGTQKQLYANSVSVQVATVAAGAAPARDTYVGTNSDTGTFINCQFDRWYCIKNVGTNLATFDADLDTLIAIMAV